jgi:outer membrane protein
MSASTRKLGFAAALSAALSLFADAAAAGGSDPLTGLLAPGESGVGLSFRYQPSVYIGGVKDTDFLPLVVYDSEYFYIESYRAGLKLERSGWRNELFIERRFEGFASNLEPASMTGMAQRHIGGDLGLATSHAWGGGTAYAEILTDVSGNSDGSELRVGYRHEAWWNGRFRWRPYVTVSFRDAKLNNYYYGVQPSEATPERPAYEPGAGVNLELGLQAAYHLTSRWQIFGGVSLIAPSSGIRGSPVVEDAMIPSVSVGLMYGFAPDKANMSDRKPLIMRAYYGASTECDLFPIITLQCTSTHTQNGTSVAAFEVGQTLVRRLNGWNADIAGFIGLLSHLEDGQQPDFWQVQAYLKYYYYGFPWRETVRTRVGFGFGIAYASHIPYTEVTDQALRGRDTSKLLLYLDPTVDVNLGDIVRAKSLRETYLGLGVSHRSGVFGAAKLFNNVDGGSNYIYAYLEWQM